MLERSRLFLIIGLGEAILTSGTAIADGRPSAAMVLTAAMAMVVIIALWALYFSGSDHLVNKQAETTSDPLRAARLAVNTQVVVFASLIAIAVANELAIAQPTAHGGLVESADVWRCHLVSGGSNLVSACSDRERVAAAAWGDGGSRPRRVRCHFHAAGCRGGSALRDPVGNPACDWLAEVRLSHRAGKRVKRKSVRTDA